MTKPQVRRILRSTSILIRATALSWLALAVGVPATARAAATLSVVYDPTPDATYVPGQSRSIILKFSAASEDVGGAALTLAALPPGVTIDSGSRSCSHSTGSSCGAAGSGGALYSGATIKAGGTLTIGATLNFAANATGNKTVTATGSSTDTGVANATASHSFTRTPVADLDVEAVGITTGSPVNNCPADSATYTPGCAAQYKVTVENLGPDAANGASVSIERSEAAAGAFTWSCSDGGTAAVCPPVSSTSPFAIATFPSGGTLTFTVTVNHATTDTYTGVGITASAAPPNGTVDTTSSNDSDTSTARTRNASANLKAEVTATTISSPATHCPGNATQYTPGCQATYEVKFTNTGPDAANGAKISLARSVGEPAALAWSCSAGTTGAVCPSASGTTAFSNVSVTTFPSTGVLTYTVTVSHAANELYDQAGIDASIAVPTGSAERVDIDHSDNTSSASRTIDRRAALRVVKRALQNGSVVTQLPANQAFDYEITVYNDGPSDIGNLADGTVDTSGPALLLADTFNALLKGIPTTCTQTGDKPCWTLCPSTLGWTNPEGQNVADEAHCPVTAVNGSAGLINQRFALRAGTGSRLMTRVNVPSVTAATNVVNTASVSAWPCPTPAGTCKAVTVMGASANQSSSATVLIQPASQASIAVANLGGDDDAVPGLEHSYKITVSNAGSMNLTSVAINSILPLATGAVTDGFVPGSIYYTCQAFDSAVCFKDGASGQAEPTQPVYNDALNVNSVLPANGRVEFTVTGRLDPRALADLTLPAEVSSTGVIATMSASTTLHMTPQYTLTLSKRLKSRSNATLPTLSYELIAGNEGPSFASGAELKDGSATVDTSTDFDFDNASWTCTALPAPAPAVAPAATQCRTTSGSKGIGDVGGTALLLDLMPGGLAVVELNVAVTNSAGNQVTNKASLSLLGTSTRFAQQTTTLRLTYTLDVTKTDGLAAAHPGADHQYSITVLNNGPDDAYDVQVHDQMPVELENVQWTCAAISPVPGDLAPLQATVDPTPVPGLGLTISRDGRHVYVIGQKENEDHEIIARVYAYRRNATPGLGYGQVDMRAFDEEVEGIDDASDTGSAVSGLEDPIDLTLSPDGTVLYVLTRAAGQPHIVVFNRNAIKLDVQEFGKLSYAGTVNTAMAEPQRIVATASNVYVSGSVTTGGAGQIEVYRPDNTSKLPIPVAGGITAAPADVGAMAVDSGRGALFVASRTSSDVRRYQIAASGPGAGLLTQSAQTTHGAQFGYVGISDLVLAPNGRDLYLHSNNSGNPRIGYLRSEATQLSFSGVYGNAAGTRLTGSVRLALAPDGEHLIGVNGSNNSLFSMRRNTITGDLSGGNSAWADVEYWLTRNGVTGSIKAIGVDAPTAVLVTPDNRHVLVSSGSVTGPIGPLTVLSRRAPEPQLGFIEQDRQSDAILGTQSTIDHMTGPADVVSRGDLVYVLSKQDESINLFRRRLSNVGVQDDDGGHLSFVARWTNGEGGITGMVKPDRVLISPDGNSLFVSSVEANALAVFRRDPLTGLLTYARNFTSSNNPGLTGARGMAMNRGGTHLYVAGSFSSSIAIFSHDPNNADRLVSVGTVAGGQGGVTGLNGIRDLVMAGDDASAQLIGVADAAHSVVVFDRQSNGQLDFVQSLVLGGSQRPMALALSPDINGSDNAHVYVAEQNNNSLIVLQRILDNSDPQFGRIRVLSTLVAGGDAPASMSGPRSVAVSPNGKRVYVAAQFGSSLVAFDRYDTSSSSLYGKLNLAEVRTQDIDSVDGIAAPYAVAVSGDSRNVYVAGFDSDAVASFSVGTGSMCSAAGSGDIDDVVTIRAGGAVIYTVNSKLRSNAKGTLSNTATATGPEGTPTDSDTDTTPIVTSAALEVSKTNNQVSTTPGMPVTYDVLVRNAGPGNVFGLDDPQLANISDLFGCTPDGAGGHDCSASPFEPGSISWTCSASGSGALDFLSAYQDGSAGISGLAGVSSVALIPAGAVGNPNAVRANYVVAASVDDDALVFFKRNAATGDLSFDRRIDSDAATPLLGARSVAVSQDGTLLFVASRQSDSLVVFSLTGSGTDDLIVTRMAVAKNPTIKGLDQALHVVAVPAGVSVEHVYVAGANDHAVAAFSYDRTSGTLIHVGSVENGVGMADGLSDVEYLVASPDGGQVYALSGSTGNVVQLDRNASTGVLTYAGRFGSGALGVDLSGVSSGTLGSNGKYLYLTVAGTNRLVELERITNASAGNYGNLSLVSSIGQGEQGTQGLNRPRRAVITADGQHLYVSSQSGSTVAWFSLHPDTGVPTYQGIQNDDTGGVDGLAGATGMVIDPVLNQIYVAGTLDSAVTHFARQSDSWCPPSGTGVIDHLPVNIAAGGHVLFHLTATVSSQLQGELHNTASANWQSAACNGGAGPGLQPCGLDAEDVDQPSVLANLSITKDDGLAEFDGLLGASAIVADASNVYVAGSDDHGIGMFQRLPSAATGLNLTYLGALRSGSNGASGLTSVADLVTSADGRNVYAVSPVDNAVTSYVRDNATGKLTQIDIDQNGLLGVAGISGARALAISPDGEHVYVAGDFSNAVAVFKRQTLAGAPDEGKLSFVEMVQSGVNGVIGIASPRALQLSPDGKQLYVLGSTSDALVLFARQTNAGSSNFGKLTQVATYQNGNGGALGMDEVRSLAISADGAHLYVLGAEAGSLVHYARNAADGTLSFVPHSVQAEILLLPELVDAGRMHLAGDGRLYIAATAQDAIAVVEFDAQGTPSLARMIRNGDPSGNPMVGLIDGLDGIADVAYVHDGAEWLYTAASLDAALSEFSLNVGEPAFLGNVLDGLGGVAPGDTVTYQIVVKNHGPSDVLDGRVVDNFPAVFTQVNWTCSGYAGGSCASSGNGNIDMSNVLLPNGGSIQIQAVGTVRADAAGRRLLAMAGGVLTNTATVEGVGVLDPDMSDNSATDGNTVMSPSMNLSVTVHDNGCTLGDPGCTEVTEATPGGNVQYAVSAANAGPTYAQSARLSDSLPAALYDVSWTCLAVPQAGLLSQYALEDSDVDTDYRRIVVDTLGNNAYAIGTRTDLSGPRDTVAAFRRNGLNGALTRIRGYSTGDTEVLPGGGNSAPVSGIEGAVDLALSVDGRNVYVAGQTADAISIFARDPLTGTLSWKGKVVNGELGVQGIGGISSLAVSPDGQHLYAGAASGDSVAVFNIDAGTGMLGWSSVIRQSDAGVNGLNEVTDLAFNDDGSVLFVTARANRSVTALRRNDTSGALTYITSIEDGQVGVTASLLSPSTLTVSGDRVVVADEQGDAVNLLRFVDGDTPAFELDEVLALDADGTDFTQSPRSLVFVPDQARLYIGSATSNQLRLYSLLAGTAQLLETYDDGSLSTALTTNSSLALSPDARQLYATSLADGQIATLARERGSRCPLAGSGALSTQVVDIAPNGHVDFSVTGSIFANATGTLTYSAAIDTRKLEFETDMLDNRASDTDTLVPAPDLETRKLRQTPDAQVIAGLPVSWRLEVDNHGVSDALGAQMIETAPFFDAVIPGLTPGSDTWTCAANEPLAAGAGLAVSTDAKVSDLSSLIETSDGGRWFALSKIRSALVQVTLDAGGQITAVSSWLDGDDAGGSAIAGLTQPTDLALSPDGSNLYVSAAGSNSVLVFAVQASDLRFVQKLTSGQDAVTGLRGASSVAVSPDGRFVYVGAVPASNVNESAIALFKRDADSGELTFVERIQDGLGTFASQSNVIRGIKQLHVTADGRNLYTLATTSQAVAQFSIDASTGKLSYRDVLRATAGNGGTVLPVLAGARDLVATPADTQLYVLSDQGITLFNRALNGSLSQTGNWPAAGSTAARDLDIDVWGSRLYQTDDDGTVHLYARQWSDGALEHRFSTAGSLTGASLVLTHLAVRGELVLAQAGTQGGISRWSEQAISRCLTANGGQAELPVPLDLGVGGNAWFSYDATVHPSARGTLHNEATTVPAMGGVDPNPANDVGVDDAVILVQSDLAITKTGPATAVAGEYVQYVITVSNAGPSNALGIHIKDDLDPARFVDASWTCTATGDSVCAAASGSGATLDAVGDLWANQTITITLNVKVNPAWIGALQNAAYVVPEPGATDPTPGDHSATPVDTEVSRHADLVVTKTTAVAEVVAGMPVTYSITVHNAGPSDAPSVQVDDVLHVALLNQTWTCSTQLGSGACAHASGHGSIHETANIPVGETLQYQVSAQLSSGTVGTLSNTATAAVLLDANGTALDPDTGNNSSTVTDPILTRADLSVVGVAPDAYDPASPVAMPYRVVVSNAGPSDAKLNVLSLQFSHPVAHTNSQCQPLQGTQFTCAIANLVAGNSTTVSFGLSQLPAVPATLTGNLGITSQTSDPASGNNGATTSTQMATGVDLAVSIADDHIGLAPGDGTRYTITVRNVGSVDAMDARVQVPLAPELVDASWTCTAPAGAFCNSTGNGGIDELVDVPAGSTIVFTLAATLDHAVDPWVTSSYTQNATVTADVAQTEVSTQNNTASDTNVIYKVIYKDGFEDPIVPREGEPISLKLPPTIQMISAPLPDALSLPPPAGASVQRLWLIGGQA
ncbi:MAG TPA: beta-propeller fold lactonase family protein [Chiayiivirga sp.]|nr:beta-propeller fold lactonase family protein [Chiayiivirga sp.]